MTTSVNLSELIEEIEFQCDEIEKFYHKPTGGFARLGEEAICGEGNDEELSRHIEESPKDYIALPTQYEIDDYSIMVDFIDSLNDEKAQAVLSSAIRGSGAFRRFKDTLHTLDLAEQWYRYQEQAHKKVAIEWCEENELSFEDDEN